MIELILTRIKLQRFRRTLLSLRAMILLLMTYACGASSLASGATTITADTGTGNLGTLVTPDLSNHQYSIDNGTQQGSNLFHSFNQFQLENGDTALFRGSSGLNNIFARVTGGSSSNINGRLKLDNNIRSSNLFLMNPAGISFNEQASLDLDGSFYAITADFIDFADSSRFYSDETAGSSSLSVAAPESFGFLEIPFGGQVKPITISGSHLEVAQGQSLAFVTLKRTIAGVRRNPINNLKVSNGRFDAPGGLISFAELDSGEQVGIESVTDARVGSATLPANFNPEQDIFIRSGRLVIDSVRIGETGLSTGSIDVAVTNDVTLRGDARLSSQIMDAHINIDASSVHLNDEARIVQSSSSTDGTSGGISINSEQLILSGESTIQNSLTSSMRTAVDIDINATKGVEMYDNAEITSSTSGVGGDGGTIDIATNSLKMHDSASIGSTTSSSVGSGGIINISANGLNLHDSVRITSSTTADGNAGIINVNASKSLEMHDSASITSNTTAAGNGGNITAQATALTMSGGKIDTSTTGTGSAGNITIAAEQLKLQNDSTITSSTNSSGMGGIINIDTSKSLEIQDSANITSNTTADGNAGNIATQTAVFTMGGGKVDTSTTGTGSAGNITISAEQLTLQQGSIVTSSTHSAGDGGNIVTNANLVDIKGSIKTESLDTDQNSGNGGRIAISARNNVSISDNGTVSSRSEGGGLAGTITLKTPQLRLNKGRISTEALQSDGGDIAIEGNSPAKLVSLQNNSAITATVGGGPQTTGGNIDINADLVVTQNSMIIAEANLGTGGNISIHSQGLFLDTDSRISASSRFGVDGTVEIDSVTEVIEGALGLPESYLSVVNLRQQTCAQRYSVNKASSFTVMNKAGLPYNPELMFSGSHALTPKFAILDSLSNNQVSSFMTAAASCVPPNADL